MMKIFLFVLSIGISILFLSPNKLKAQPSMIDVDSLFIEIKFDTLQLYAEIIQGWMGWKQIPASNIENLNFYKKGRRYYGYNKFYIDKDRKYKAYLVKSENGSLENIFLLTYKLENKKLIFTEEIAVYELLHLAYERNQNAWISDFNCDGNLDIGICDQLIDYEMGTAESPNTSRSEQYIYFFKDGKYEMENWNSNILKKYPLMKRKHGVIIPNGTKNIYLKY